MTVLQATDETSPIIKSNGQNQPTFSLLKPQNATLQVIEMGSHGCFFYTFTDMYCLFKENPPANKTSSPLEALFLSKWWSQMLVQSDTQARLHHTSTCWKLSPFAIPFTRKCCKFFGLFSSIDHNNNNLVHHYSEYSHKFFIRF